MALFYGVRKFLNKHDRMTRSFNKSVKKAIKEHFDNGVPVARYDFKTKRAYLEYPDGTISYD